MKTYWKIAIALLLVAVLATLVACAPKPDQTITSNGNDMTISIPYTTGDAVYGWGWIPVTPAIHVVVEFKQGFQWVAANNKNGETTVGVCGQIVQKWNYNFHMVCDTPDMVLTIHPTHLAPPTP